MNDLVEHNPTQRVTSDDLLHELSQFGEVSLSMMNRKTWWCRVELFVNVPGSDFNIKGDSGCATPALAIQDCLDKVKAMLNQVDSLKQIGHDR